MKIYYQRILTWGPQIEFRMFMHLGVKNDTVLLGSKWNLAIPSIMNIGNNYRNVSSICDLVPDGNLIPFHITLVCKLWILIITASKLWQSLVDLFILCFNKEASIFLYHNLKFFWYFHVNIIHFLFNSVSFFLNIVHFKTFWERLHRLDQTKKSMWHKVKPLRLGWSLLLVKTVWSAWGMILVPC